MSSGGYRVNWERVAATVDSVQRSRRLTQQAVARQAGVSRAALGRLKAGQAISADSLAALMAWVSPVGLPAWIEEAKCPTQHNLSSHQCGSTASPSTDSAPDTGSAGP